MRCELAHLDGAYVLGALSSTERLDYERHLVGCAECAQAVRELAGLPGLLAQVDLADLDAPPVAAPLPETLLPSLVRQVRGTQRRRSILTAAVAAAVAAVAVGSLALGGAFSGPDRSPVSAAPSVSATTGTPGEAMLPVGRTPVLANVAVTSVAWGTRLDLTCTYATDAGGYEASPAAAYALVVRTRGGRVEQVATWRALPGKTMHLSAATATSRSEIATIEVRTSDGTVVLRLPV